MSTHPSGTQDAPYLPPSMGVVGRYMEQYYTTMARTGGAAAASLFLPVSLDDLTASADSSSRHVHHAVKALIPSRTTTYTVDQSTGKLKERANDDTAHGDITRGDAHGDVTRGDAHGDAHGDIARMWYVAPLAASHAQLCAMFAQMYEHVVPVAAWRISSARPQKGPVVSAVQVTPLLHWGTGLHPAPAERWDELRHHVSVGTQLATLWSMRGPRASAKHLTSNAVVIWHRFLMATGQSGELEERPAHRSTGQT